MQFPFDIASKAINKALDSDTGNKNYLRSLGDILLTISTKEPVMHFLVHISDGSVDVNKVSDLEELQSDIKITGTSTQLLKLLFQPAASASELQDSGIRIDGDIGLLIKLTQISGQIEFDWEALLADQVGEPVAVVAGKGFRHLRTASKSLADQQKTFVRNRLSQPNDLVPTREEFNAFKSNVRDLNYRLDRLEARVANHRRPAADVADKDH